MSSSIPALVPGGTNTIWLTFPETPQFSILRCQLLGIGADHSLICRVPALKDWNHLQPGMRCRGQTLLEGETYQFETTVQKIHPEQEQLELQPPSQLRHRAPRAYPRVPVEVAGSLRPLSYEGKVLAVLPCLIRDLCPTGCQLTVQENLWPNLATLRIILTCQLPGLTHRSKFFGTIEWIDPLFDLYMGVQFTFASSNDVACQDLLRWFSSQRAKFVDTTA
ncbi:MAG: hypothetical protein D6704_02530 [Nitrospirae bacterium]|nr:MAG: hypothetical protein D6704_02530 [Nitrospirota bacterium]